jgi:hypothetical protein
MGARNALAALAMYPDLNHRAMRLLLGMSLTALDGDTEDRMSRLYFGGEVGLRQILGGVARRSVYEALAELEEAGAITTLVRGRARNRATYRVNTDPIEGRGVPSRVRKTRTQQGAANTHTEGAANTHTEGAANTHTKEVLEEPLRNYDEENSASSSTSPRARETSGGTNEPISEDEYKRASRVIDQAGTHGSETVERIARDDPDLTASQIVITAALALEAEHAA